MNTKYPCVIRRVSETSYAKGPGILNLQSQFTVISWAELFLSLFTEYDHKDMLLF